MKSKFAYALLVLLVFLFGFAPINSYADSILRVAAFNLYNPGNHPDSTYEAWGRDLGSRADVLMLSEVGDEKTAKRHVKLLADAAGMRYFEIFRDLAIVSRTPLQNVKRLVIKPDSIFPLSEGHNSGILSVQTNINQIPHQFIANHWGVRDVNMVDAYPWLNSPTRLRAAKAVIGLADRSMPVFVGGDLNAYSGYGPQERPGGTPEVDELRIYFKDAFIEMGLSDADYCSDHRIDYMMVSGSYVPVKYNACLDGRPSDHPFVLVEFKKDTRLPPHDKPIACSVFNDGNSNASSLSEAIYFAGSEAACTPDGTARGFCRRWFGNCVSTTDHSAVTFKVFNDGESGATSSSSAVYNRDPNVACIPDGTSSGNCRRWFGLPMTADRYKAECYLFDDGLTNWIGPTHEIYYRAPGQVCMPNGTSAGACRKWFGNCQVTNQQVPLPPPPTPREQCVRDCKDERDACMADVATKGGPRPQQCVQLYRGCLRGCPP